MSKCPTPPGADCISRPYLVDHVEGALEDGVKDLRYLTGDVSPQLVDNGRHGAEHLRFAGGWDVALVVNENSVQQRRNKVLSDLKRTRRMVSENLQHKEGLKL